MLGPIIDLRCRFCPGVFLLVVDPVFGTGLHSRLLHSEDGLVGCFTREEGVGTEAFPVSTSFREMKISTLRVVSHP